jgi:flagellar hook assembly protein FlgD
MSNKDLLTQLSTMSQLQSTQDLDKALQTNTNNQQLSIASSFIGRAVQGKDSNNNLVSGIAQEAVLQNGTAEVAVGNSLLPVANITAVAPAQSGGLTGRGLRSVRVKRKTRPRVAVALFD